MKLFFKYYWHLKNASSEKYFYFFYKYFLFGTFLMSINMTIYQKLTFYILLKIIFKLICKIKQLFGTIFNNRHHHHQ